SAASGRIVWSSSTSASSGSSWRSEPAPRRGGRSVDVEVVRCGVLVSCPVTSRVPLPESAPSRRTIQKGVPMKLDRKDFLKSVLIVAGATVGLTEIGACGGDD